jgi:hypothetical protein
MVAPDPIAEWYFHVTAGGSFYDLKGTPIPLTRAMAHHLANAVDDLSHPAVFRWAQFKAMNMPEVLIDWFAATRFMYTFEYEDFWETVFILIVKEYDAEAIAEEDLGLLFVYIGYIKYGMVVGGAESQRVTAPEPAFTMKGRKLTALLRDAKRWYGQNAALFRQWEPSGINSFAEVEGPEDKSVSYALVEMLNTYELSTEGQAMSHCVGDYADNCREGTCSIWSLRRYEGERFRRLVTIEVSTESRMLVQICGPCNEPPTELDMKLIFQWAQREKLDLGEFAPQPGEPVIVPQEQVGPAQPAPAQPVAVPAPAIVPPPAPRLRPEPYNTSDRATWITVVLIAKATLLLLRALAS